ncbi:MAG: type IV pilus modification protein PilV [Trichloromonadaceae bacterium]
MENIRSNQQGFTLLELLIAISIFAIGLLSIAGMQITAIRTNSSANTLTAGSALAAGILEEVLAWPAAEAPLKSNSSNNAWDFDPSTSSSSYSKFINGSGQYTATYSVEKNYEGSADLSRITVVVTGNGRTSTVVGFKRVL